MQLHELEIFKGILTIKMSSGQTMSRKEWSRLCKDELPLIFAASQFPRVRFITGDYVHAHTHMISLRLGSNGINCAALLHQYIGCRVIHPDPLDTISTNSLARFLVMDTIWRFQKVASELAEWKGNAISHKKIKVKQFELGAQLPPGLLPHWETLGQDPFASDYGDSAPT